MAFLISISGAPVNSDDFNGVVGSVFGPVASTGSNNVDDGSFAQTDDAFLEGSYLDVVTDVIFRTGGNDTICPIVTQTPLRIDYTVPNVGDGTYAVILLVDANNTVTEFPTPFNMQVSLTNIFIPGDGTTPWDEVIGTPSGPPVVGNGTFVKTISNVNQFTGARILHVLSETTSYEISARTNLSFNSGGSARTAYHISLRVLPINNGSYQRIFQSHSIFHGLLDFTVREFDVLKGTFATVLPGDTLAIRRTYQASPLIDLIEYKLNGVVLYTSLLPIFGTGIRYIDIGVQDRADLDQIKITEF